jgi:hypothetical protein
MFSHEIRLAHTQFIVLRIRDMLTDRYFALINHANVGVWVSARIIERNVSELKLSKGNAAVTEWRRRRLGIVAILVFEH